MSRIEAGMLDLYCALFDLNDFVKRLLPLFSAEICIRIKLDLASGLPPVSLDQVRINTVIRNLLNYSPDDSIIEVRTYQIEGQMVFAVRDYGVGASAEKGAIVTFALPSP